MEVELAGPQAAPQPHLEPVSHMWLTKFLRTHGLIHDCPKLVQLRTFPTIAIGGPDDVGEGRWVPTTSVDEYSATLAKWYGISSQTDLATVLPNIGRFGKPDLGFMNPLP